MSRATSVVLLQVVGMLAAAVPGRGADPLGAATCSASGCHGGAGEHNGQFVIWSERDAHARAYATLTTARAERIADALGIASAVASPRCTVCHAPLAAAGPAADPAESVSCVSCHGVPTAWLRSHTRPDWTHADRVAAGLRDLNDLYTRADTCVACHQNLDPELVRVGRHPALLFELDGQSQDEPRHWTDAAPGAGAQAWYVGQAVALREVSWALLNREADPARSTPAWQGLLWLLGRAGEEEPAALPAVRAANADTLAAAMAGGDRAARRAAQHWPPAEGTVILRRLAGTAADFAAPGIPGPEQSARADRLVLALDRLLQAEAAAPPAASASLDRLFHLAQSPADFDPAAFARELGSFAAALGPVSGPSGRS